MKVFDKIDFLDDDPNCELAIGRCIDNESFAGEYSYAFPAFGDNALRFKWMEKLEENLFVIPILIHPSAYISPSASVYPGTVVEAKAMINTSAVVERCCIVGLGAIINHGTFIGYACHIECGAIVKPCCVVMANTTVASGRIITRDNLPSSEDFLKPIF